MLAYPVWIGPGAWSLPRWVRAAFDRLMQAGKHVPGEIRELGFVLSKKALRS